MCDECEVCADILTPLTHTTLLPAATTQQVKEIGIASYSYLALSLVETLAVKIVLNKTVYQFSLRITLCASLSRGNIMGTESVMLTFSSLEVAGYTSTARDQSSNCKEYTRLP